MKQRSRISTARLIQRRDAWMKKLAELGPMTRGSLVTARRGNHIVHQLTVSVQGKTHTVYVPKDMIEEVKVALDGRLKTKASMSRKMMATRWSIPTASIPTGSRFSISCC